MSFKLLPIALALASAPVLAEEAAEQEKIWSGDIEFGYTNLSGNTEETTTVGKFLIKRESAPWKWQTFVEGLASEKDDERTAEKYGMFSRLEYNWTDKNYVFGRVSYEEDKFSGFKNQYTVTSGVGWNLYDLETLAWDVEAGLGYRFEESEDIYDEITGALISLGEKEEEPIVRLSTIFSWDFAENAKFVQLLSSEMGDENTISYSRTALEVKIIGELALKVSYNIKYTEEVPAETEHADKETLVTLSYSF
ncbi:YdiY family protein [Thalassomonas sp. M1454]|uniref:DUF481 domain-containing protein n=1 Tax=Thalassomonas sp. M1454 TaxID=2594477 RepID=UPI001180A774|nr:DUF481 domain-containing protein [Thalassomonas sp. M1454]TRX53921.1 DUF481 domain-containing protein [Thalassomonas sp. M1454]